MLGTLVVTSASINGFLLSVGVIVVMEVVAVLLAGILLICGGILAYARPRRIILIGIILTALVPQGIPWDLLPARGIATALELVLVMLAMLWRYGKAPRARFGKILRNPYLVFLLLFQGIVTGYILISPNTSYGIYKAFFLFIKAVLPTLALACLAPFDERELRIIFRSIVVGGVLAALNLLFFGDPSQERGGLESPITYARTIGLGITTLVASAINPISRQQFVATMLSGAVTCFMFIALLTTGTRGPVVGCVLGVLSSLLFLARATVIEQSRAFIRVLVTAACLAAFGLVFIDIIRGIAGLERILLMLGSLGSNTSDVGRITRMELAVDLFRRSGFLGIGTGGFAFYSAGSGRDYPHNVFLEVACEQGIPGLLSLSLVLVSAMARAWRFSPYPHSRVLAGLWIFSLTNSLVSFDIAGNYHLWILGALLWLYHPRMQVP